MKLKVMVAFYTLLAKDLVVCTEIDLTPFQRPKRENKEAGVDQKFSEMEEDGGVLKNKCGLQMEMVHSSHDMAYLLCTWKKGKHPRWKSPEIPAHAARVTNLRDLGQTVLSFHWDALPSHKVTVTCGVGRFKGEKGRRTRRAKENGGNAQDWRREGGRGRREVSGMLRRERRIQRREAMRRRRFSCSQLTHTFTRPHQQNWPEVPVWEH